MIPRVLVVDDERQIRRALKEALVEEGYSVLTAESGEEAVRLLDLTLLRIGGLQYAADNESYGLTTLLSEHVTVGRGAVQLCFPGKSGVEQTVRVADATSRTRSKSTSPHSRPATRLIPTSTTTAPGRTMSAVTNRGWPIAAINTSAWRVIWERSCDRL